MLLGARKDSLATGSPAICLQIAHEPHKHDQKQQITCIRDNHEKNMKLRIPHIATTQRQLAFDAFKRLNAAFGLLCNLEGINHVGKIPDLILK